MKEKLGENPSSRQRVLWAAARALGWSPFDPRLLALSPLQMEWAIMMADPEVRPRIEDEKLQERDRAAVALLEWHREHVTRRD